MTELSKHTMRGAAGTLRNALNESADDLESQTPESGHDHRVTLVIVAGTCFLLGFLWAKARAQAF
jgi:hypothetical protein